MCPSAPRVCSDPGGQKPVLSMSLDRIINELALVQINRSLCKWQAIIWTNDDLVSNAYMHHSLGLDELNIQLEEKTKHCNWIEPPW